MINLLHLVRAFARPRRPRLLIGCALLAGLVLGFGACGSGDKTIASIDGHTQVTRSMLDHWMVVVLGGDYDAALGEVAPEGLVSEPADSERCVRVAATIVPKVAGRPKLNQAQLQLKCRQLDAGIREQALSYVLSVLWVREQAKEAGLHLPTAAEISAKINALVHAQFNDSQNFRKIISEQHRSLADVRFLIKRNILQDELTPRLKAQTHGDERAYLKLVLQSNASWQRRTSCAEGYQAWECKQYSGKEAKPPPAVVLEYLKKGVA